MQFPLMTNRFFLFLIFFCLFSTSCSSKLYSIKSSTSKDINLVEDFLIEGKFKYTTNILNKRGYFLLIKKDNKLDIVLGRNFLLPERQFSFGLNQSLNLGELIGESPSSDRENFKISVLLSYIKGSPLKPENKTLKVSYPNGFSYIDNYRMPIKIMFEKEDVQLILIIKKVS